MKLPAFKEKLLAYTWDLEGVTDLPPFNNKYAQFLDWEQIAFNDGMPVSLRLFTKPGLEEMEWNFGLQVSLLSYTIILENNQDHANYKGKRFKVISIDDNKMKWKNEKGDILHLKGVPHISKQ